MSKSQKSSRPRSFQVEEYKIKASILLKSLHGKDASQAAKRFQRLPEYADLSIAEILKEDIKRKHALRLIAIENGFDSWVDLKIQVNFIVGGYLNSWFASYEEAYAHLKSTQGFLLPYKSQFFICNADYMKHIGFDPSDPDWEHIGHNWVMHEDKEAWQRLYLKWLKILGKNHV